MVVETAFLDVAGVDEMQESTFLDGKVAGLGLNEVWHIQKHNILVAGLNHFRPKKRIGMASLHPLAFNLILGTKI